MAFSQKNRIKVALAIHNREPFKHASMRGEWISQGQGWYGQLPQETVNTMRELLKDRDLYVIYSYATPIGYAWDREIHIPDHRYSVTTTHHQSIVRLANHYALNY
jgi:hypothetical protein